MLAAAAWGLVQYPVSIFLLVYVFIQQDSVVNNIGAWIQPPGLLVTSTSSASFSPPINGIIILPTSKPYIAGGVGLAHSNPWVHALELPKLQRGKKQETDH